jgi:hypothetical protein
MTQDNDRNDRSLGLSTAQVVGSALAAMSGAVSASWLGTTGTLIGAAVGSVIATVGASIYTHSLRRTGQVVKRTAVVVRQGAPFTGAVPRPDPGMASDAPVRDPNAPEAGDETTEPLDRDETSERSGRFSRLFSGGRDLPWVKVSLASLAVLVAALGGITAVEAITGKPISSLLGGDDSDGTTVGHVVGNDDAPAEDEPAPQQDTPAPDDQSEPSEEPQEPVPSESPVPSPSAEPSDGPELPSTEDGTTETQP